ncbi:hypothetical protein FrEUN1fDRAFT_0801 [Parafrankia sp. EUN1f]|nr:hypothetical protein FrEUN1fDRAFT_0801 [Parafrankia sp. EUN1f]
MRTGSPRGAPNVFIADQVRSVPTLVAAVSEPPSLADRIAETAAA